jgi:hypothetical protein
MAGIVARRSKKKIPQRIVKTNVDWSLIEWCLNWGNQKKLLWWLHSGLDFRVGVSKLSTTNKQNTSNSPGNTWAFTEVKRKADRPSHSYFFVEQTNTQSTYSWKHSPISTLKCLLNHKYGWHWSNSIHEKIINKQHPPIWFYKAMMQPIAIFIVSLLCQIISQTDHCLKIWMGPLWQIEELAPSSHLSLPKTLQMIPIQWCCPKLELGSLQEGWIRFWLGKHHDSGLLASESNTGRIRARLHRRTYFMNQVQTGTQQVFMDLMMAQLC